MQHGYGERGAAQRGDRRAGRGAGDAAGRLLAKNRIDPGAEALKRPLDGPYYRERSPKFEKITVPLLSAANWGGMGLHPRGNFEGYLAAASKQKWLEVHGNSHFAPFYRPDGEALQKRFFGHFLKGENTGWDKQPPVQLQVRHPGEKFVMRDEQEWPLARTQWTQFYLDPASRTLAASRSRARPSSTKPSATALASLCRRRRRRSRSPGRWRPSSSSLRTRPMPTFPCACVFSIRRARRFYSSAPTIPACRSAWVGCAPRSASSIPSVSLPYRPYHPHDESWPLKPGEPVELDIEIWPTSIVVPPGYRFVLNVRGKDFDHGLGDRGFANAPYPMRGTGNLLHNDPQDRPPAIFGGTKPAAFCAGKRALPAAADHPVITRIEEVMSTADRTSAINKRVWLGETLQRGTILNQNIASGAFHAVFRQQRQIARQIFRRHP